MAKLGRRAFTLGLRALLSGGCSRFSTHAGPRPACRLSPREDFLLCDGYLLTMEPSLGDLPRGSLLVRQGRIVEVGQDVSAPGVPVIDAEGMIVLPGLVDTHWHMWNTRSFGWAQGQAPDVGLDLEGLGRLHAR